MDETDLRAYVGLLILAGVYRSRGEVTASLWDTESGRAIFRATMPPKVFHTYSRLDRTHSDPKRHDPIASSQMPSEMEVSGEHSEAGKSIISSRLGRCPISFLVEINKWHG